ncbi:MAG: acetyl-CoA carboxylase biotin carboxyl carrier protein [Planctomycetaceae bacterium]|jgi:acetyl-CoA carboxylase biotin carboxyl carrier protein|nr:acetyl-CoA carboxylase biotin carboxyl carrier protein [Planctomycetaceae bacterium]
MVNSPKTKKSGADVFNIRQVKKLIDLMKSNDLSEIDLQQADVRIQIKRNVSVPLGGQPYSLPVAKPAAAPPPTDTVAISPKTPPAESKNNETNDAKSHIITSPMVGTFYASMSPDLPPLVSVGDVVAYDKTVCLIEAMKVYNEIQAECSGKVIAVLVKNGEAVEYGRPLFRIEIA